VNGFATKTKVKVGVDCLAYRTWLRCLKCRWWFVQRLPSQLRLDLKSAFWLAGNLRNAPPRPLRRVHVLYVIYYRWLKACT